MKTIKTYSLVLFLLAAPLFAISQVDSLALKLPNKITEDYFLKESFWLNSINSSGINQSGIKKYSKVELNFGYEDGKYRKAYDPKTNSIINFNTIGIKSYKKLHFLGTFNYNRQVSKKIGWCQMMDIERDNPFMLTDSIGGDWIKDEYTLGLKVGSDPIWKTIKFGLNINYYVGMGGRDNDPRPKSLIKNIDIMPSITFSIGNQKDLGLSYIYRDYMQTIDINVNAGIGSAYYFPVLGLKLDYEESGKTLDYRIEAHGNGVSAVYQSVNDIDMILEGSYILSTERDISKPKTLVTDTVTNEVHIKETTDARFSEQQYNFNFGLDLKKLRTPQKISIGFGYNDGKLYDHRMDQVDYTRKRTTVFFKYIALLNASNVNKVASITISAKYINEDVEQAFYATRNMKSLISFAKIEKAFSIFKQELCGEISIQGKFNLNSSLEINPKSVFIPAETTITVPITWSNFYYDKAEWVNPSFSLTYYPAFSKKFKTYIGGNWSSVILTNDSYYNDGTRNFVQAKLGFLF